MFDTVLPSTATGAGLAVTETFATAVVVPPPGGVVVPEPLNVDEPPPHPAKSAVAIQAMIENLRMSFNPRSTSCRRCGNQ
jgi:hypothetical protein